MQRHEDTILSSNTLVLVYNKNTYAHINLDKKYFSLSNPIFSCMQSFSYFLLTLALEIFPSLKLTLFTIKKWWGKTNIFPHNTTYLEPLLESSPETVVMDLDEDVDVKTERNRVLSGSIDNAIIYLHNLRKVFPRIISLNLSFSFKKLFCI